MSQPPADLRSHSPLVLDATVLAHGGMTWEHEFRGVRFERLQELALSDTPTVQVRLSFAMQEGRPTASGRLTTELELTCQRCLAPMRHAVDEQFELMLVDSEAQMATVPEPFDPWTTNAARADVFELVEEQLLLALPLIAKHADIADCAAVLPALLVTEVAADAQTNVDAEGTSAPTETVQTPFSQLRNLMNKR